MIPDDKLLPLLKGGWARAHILLTSACGDFARARIALDAADIALGLTSHPSTLDQDVKAARREIALALNLLRRGWKSADAAHTGEVLDRDVEWAAHVESIHGTETPPAGAPPGNPMPADYHPGLVAERLASASLMMQQEDGSWRHPPDGVPLAPASARLAGWVTEDGVVLLPPEVRKRLKLPTYLTFGALSDGGFLMVPEEVMKARMIEMFGDDDGDDNPGSLDEDPGSLDEVERKDDPIDPEYTNVPDPDERMQVYINPLGWVDGTVVRHDFGRGEMVVRVEFLNDVYHMIVSFCMHGVTAPGGWVHLSPSPH